MADEALLATLDAAKAQITEARRMRPTDPSVKALTEAVTRLERVLRVMLRMLQGDERAAQEITESTP
jgi:hypothetical protein